MRCARELGLALILLSVSCGDDGGLDAATDAADDSASRNDVGIRPSDAESPLDVTAIDTGPAPDPLAPLPPARSATTDRFATSDQCATCHTAEVGNAALRDSEGRDVSMHSLWQASMMAFAARDPYYLAVFSHELESHAGSEDLVEATCTRCHTPAASVELAAMGGHPTFESLTTGTSNIDEVGRDGVTCTTCHQISDEGLGTDASYTGGFVIGDDREIFGPHEAPLTMPMVMSTGFTPVASAHVRESALCATCHTVITRSLDDEGNPTGPAFAEQAPYLEWTNSEFASSASCQSCHVPTVDESGEQIVTRISTRPGGNRLSERTPVGRHVFVGANAYMLELLADNIEWTGASVPPALLRQRAALTEQNLTTSGSVEIRELRVSEGELLAEVRVSNESGHKLPTGYPSRRVWLHFQVIGAGGETLWESGAFTPDGRLGGDSPSRLESHHTLIESEEQVQIYESVMGDADGEVTGVLLNATRYLKDNRILPRGWSDAHPNAPLTMPVGTDADTNFVAGHDDVSYRVALPPGAASVRVELLYQTLSPTELELLSDHPTPATERFRQMMEARPPAPRTISSAERGLSSP